MRDKNHLDKVEYNAIRNFHASFFGCYAQQNPKAFLSLNRLLNAEKFDTIIELGTHDGGLSSLFALYCFGSRHPATAQDANEPSLYKNSQHHKSPKQFHTFDISLRDIPRLQLLQALGTNFQQIDTLNDQNNIQYIGNIIKNGGRVLLLCDGGDKKKEFELYAPFLKQNDIIMGHDWAKDDKAFADIQTRGIWYGCEIKWKDIEGTCKQNNIAQIYSDEFDDVVWFCGIKQ